MENNKKRIKQIMFCLIIILIFVDIFILVINLYKNKQDNSLEVYDQPALMNPNILYKNYLGKQRGSTIKELLKTISAENSISKLVVSVTYAKEQIDKENDAEEILKIRDKIESRLRYEVSCNYSDDGFIDEIIIEEIEDI